MKIEGIDHVVLRVRDLEQAVAFYSTVLGCPVVRRNEKISMVQLRAGSSLIDLVDVNGVLGRKGGAGPGSDAHNMDHFCLRVESFDLDSILGHLSSHGVDIGEVATRYGSSGVGVSVYLKDPEGNGLELRPA